MGLRLPDRQNREAEGGADGGETGGFRLLDCDVRPDGQRGRPHLQEVRQASDQRIDRAATESVDRATRKKQTLLRR